MANISEKIKWNLFKIKREIMFSYGIKHNKIFAYGSEFIDKLREYYYGPLPLSIVFLLKNFCDGQCYYRAPILVYAFLDDDFECIDATVDSLRLNPELIDKYRDGTYDELYGEHCFIVRKFEDGSEWVYDTSLGLIFDKDFYYTYERPRIRKVNDKESTIWFISEECPAGNNLENDKYVLPFILPGIEANLEPTQPFYMDALKREIEMLKEKVDYKSIINEMNERKKQKEL